MYAFSILELQLLWGFDNRNEKYLGQAIDKYLKFN